jgi:hypothetical protein
MPSPVGSTLNPVVPSVGFRAREGQVMAGSVNFATAPVSCRLRQMLTTPRAAIGNRWNLSSRPVPVVGAPLTGHSERLLTKWSCYRSSVRTKSSWSACEFDLAQHACAVAGAA